MVRLKTRYILFEVDYPENVSQEVLNDEKKLDFYKFKLHLHNPLSSRVRNLPARDREIAPGPLLKYIRQVIQQHFGDYGMGKTVGSLTLKYFSPSTSKGILRVSRDHYKLVIAALFLIRSVPLGHTEKHIPVTLRVVRTSGTIRKCENYLIERNKQEAAYMRRLSEGVNGGAGKQKFLDQPAPTLEELRCEISADAEDE